MTFGGLSIASLVALEGVVLAAFVAEAAMGFGATVVAVTLGALFVPVEIILPAFVPINLILSTAIVLRSSASIAWRVLLVELAPALGLGCAAGIAAFRFGAHEAEKLLFALFVVGLALVELRGVRREALPLSRRARVALLLLGGVVHGLFGSGGPMVVYVLRRRIADKRAFRATLAVVWIALNAALLASYATMGLLRRETGELCCALGLALVPALALGELLHRRLDATRFQLAVCRLLLLGGVALAARTAYFLARPA